MPGFKPDASPSELFARQIEKDERFWVAAALLGVYHSPNRIEALAALMTRCLGPAPPFQGHPTWESALCTEQRLYFEVDLPAPKDFSEALGKRLNKSILTPYILAIAEGTSKLEGTTKADAVLVTDTGFAVVFEAKVLSDLGTRISYDIMRNQLARTVDVLLDPNENLLGLLERREPKKSCVVLLTPEIFKTNPSTRLYGWLFNAYRNDPSLLGMHLRHRKDVNWMRVSRRLGWLTFEDCNEITPGACSWLDRTQSTPTWPLRASAPQARG